MKKNLILINLALITFFLSCSTEETSENSNIQEETEVENPQTGVLSNYVLSYPSGNSFTNKFEDGKQTITTSNSNYTSSEFSYNGEEMNEANTYYSTGNIKTSYAFNYENGRLSSIDIEDDSSFFSYDHTKSLTYNDQESTITITFPSNSSEITEFRLKFTDSNYDLITEFYQEKYYLYEDNTRLVTSYIKEVFTYDSNRNCTKIVRSDAFNAEYQPTISEFNYSYDNYTNPLYAYYSSYYLETIILRSLRDNIFSFGLYEYIETFGKNNIDSINYPDSYTVYNTYSFDSFYENGLITKIETSSDYNNQVTAITTYNYE